MFFKPGQHKEMGLRYSPLKALIAPRPIGWISTLSKEGVANLAPYSFFNGVSEFCLLYTSPSPRDLSTSRMPSSA